MHVQLVGRTIIEKLTALPDVEPWLGTNKGTFSLVYVKRSCPNYCDILASFMPNKAIPAFKR